MWKGSVLITKTAIYRKAITNLNKTLALSEGFPIFSNHSLKAKICLAHLCNSISTNMNSIPHW